jgi:PDDEXK-like uncharacterized protein DUF3799
MPNVLSPGLHRGVPKGDYLSDAISLIPSLSASTAKLLVGRSPAHAWSAHPKGGRYRGETSEAMHTGTLLDSLLLGGDTELVTLPDAMPNADGKLVATKGKYLLDSAKRWRDGQLAAGKLPVDKEELGYATKAAETIKENLARDGVVLDGEHQVTAVWEDAGVRCKGRFDHWSEERLIVYDLKVVECAHPEAVVRKTIDFGWDIQGAAYVRAIETLRPEWAGRVRFVMLAVEPKPPHEVLVRPFAGTMRALGEWKWSRAVEAWARCLRDRRWPGYSGMEAGLEAPAWALARMEEGLAGGSQEVSF